MYGMGYYTVPLLCVHDFHLADPKKNLKKLPHPHWKNANQQEGHGGHLPLLSWSLPIRLSLQATMPRSNSSLWTSGRHGTGVPLRSMRASSWRVRRRRVRRRQRPVMLGLTGAVGRLLIILPRAHAIRAAWFLMFCFVHVVSFKKVVRKCVWGHVEKKKQKNHRVSWNSWSKRRNLAIRKRSANYRLIVTGIGIELCKESGCSTSWILISSQILDVRWLFIILTFSSALSQFNI